MAKDKTIGLFSFDGPLYKDKNGVYCNVTLTDEMFSRYFSVVDFLIIMVRTYSSDLTYEELNMKPITLNNVHVVEVPNLNTIKGYIVERKKFVPILDKYINRADLIFARMPSNTSNMVLNMAKKKKKKYLVEVGGCAWDSYWNHSLFGKIVAPMVYFQEKKYVAGADYSIYVTKKFLQNRYPNKKKTTNCSNVYLDIATDEVLNKRICNIKGMDQRKIVFGQAVASIDVKYKGEHLIIRAISELKKKGIDIEYQIVGPGKGNYLLNVARKYNVSDQVKFIGTMTKKEIFNWYDSIDVYVQPSKQEGLPRAVIEAMSRGCPSLGSNIAGIPELLDEECLFNPNKDSEILEVITNIIRSKKKLVNQAKTNFYRSQEYNITDIEERRKRMFLQYKNDVVNEID